MIRNSFSWLLSWVGWLLIMAATRIRKPKGWLI